MICPICKTHHQPPEKCVQCGSDLQIHYLLEDIREEIHMKDEISKADLIKKTSCFFIIFQTIPSILLLICTLFGLFIGIRFLAFMDRMESRRVSVSNTWSEKGFEQLQQMGSIIKQELDLIQAQYRDNQALQEKIQTLTKPSSNMPHASMDTPPSAQEEP